MTAATQVAATPVEHVLRSWPVYFDRVVSGEKTFEIRWDDRGFQAGDTVVLREWDPHAMCGCRDTATQHTTFCPKYTGREVRARIGFVCASVPRSRDRSAWSGDGWVVFALVGVRLVVRPGPEARAAAAAGYAGAAVSPATVAARIGGMS